MIIPILARGTIHNRSEHTHNIQLDSHSTNNSYTYKYRLAHEAQSPSRDSSGMLLMSLHRIAGNFRGIHFLRFSRLTGKPRKLNPRNKSLNAHSRYSDHPSSKIRSRNLDGSLSAKIGFLENFRLYGISPVTHLATALKEV